MAGANPSIETVTTWGALASGQSLAENSQTAILIMQTTGNCDKIAASSFALMNRLPAPVGISAASGTSLAVAVSGSVSGLPSLTPGKVYYSNSKGDLVASNSFAGHSNSLSISGLNSQSNLYYIYDADNNAYVTLESKVGIATAKDTLFVQTI